MAKYSKKDLKNNDLRIFFQQKIAEGKAKKLRMKQKMEVDSARREKKFCKNITKIEWTRIIK